MISTTNRLSFRRKKVFLGTTLLMLGALAMALGLASCQTLPSISENQCGNWVVEPNNGEACDEAQRDAGADAAPGTKQTRCGAPFEVGACRYTCEYHDESEITCPSGHDCGLDGICRKAGGLSDSPITIAGGGTQRLMSGDFDGDGRDDVVAVGFSTADVHFLTTNGFVERTITLPNERGAPGVGDVNGDKLSDIVLTLERSVGVLLGQEDRSFVPQNYTTMFVAPNTHRLVPLGAYAFDGAMLGFSESNGNTYIEMIVIYPDGGHERASIDEFGAIPGSLVGAVATTGIPKDNPTCGVAAFVIGPKGPTPARLAIASRCENNILSEGMPFDAGVPWGGAYFVDVDADGDDDLVFGVLDGVPSMKVRKFDGMAFGAVEPFIGVDLGSCIQGSPNLAGAPLAVADINLDGYADFVDQAGIVFYAAGQALRLCNANASPTMDPDPKADPKGWAHAVTGDFNGDGLPDILAARKDEAVLDLWLLHPEGNFNTLTISVGAPVDELVSADLDGDLIADAAFRYRPPVEGGMMMSGPSPIYAIFGNPLALPSAPTLLGSVMNAQHIVAGRIKGTNLLDIPDPISDLVVLSSAPIGPDQPMPLTLIQGNVTRNLVSPLSLKMDTTKPEVAGTDNVYGVFVSEFGLPACDKFGKDPMSLDTELTPSNVVALGSTGSIWLAGCKNNGSSLPVASGLDLGNVSFLFAPVDRDSTNDALAVFLHNQSTSGMGLIEYEGQDNFSSLNGKLADIDKTIKLPEFGAARQPYTFVDVDNNGLRDVILTGRTDTQSTIFIFWNGDEQNVSGTMNATDVTRFDFAPAYDENPATRDDGNIVDVVALNIDDDDYKELAILTDNNVYFAKLQLTAADEESGSKPTLVEKRPLEMHNYGIPFANVRGGKALLAIDANSDGVEDLIVADAGKLLLYLGKERFQ
ncbi:MAG: VCBS repeat-containing protein [Polyangiaceae bacterium]|nr:VCBS repeat-containing protein [Polyangiaceae bacterium]